MIEIGPACFRRGQRLVDASALRIIGQQVTSSAQYLSYIVAVIGVDRGGACKDLANPPPEGVVSEIPRSTRSRQGHAGEAVLEIPGIGGRACGVRFACRISIVVVGVRCGGGGGEPIRGVVVV